MVPMFWVTYHCIPLTIIPGYHPEIALPTQQQVIGTVCVLVGVLVFVLVGVLVLDCVIDFVLVGVTAGVLDLVRV